MSTAKSVVPVGHLLGKTAIFLLAAAAALTGFQPLADAAPADAAAAAPAAGSEQLQEVTVTATRRTETAVNTAVAVDAFSGETLQTYSVDSLQDLNRIDSSLTVNNFGASQQQIVIRGISSDIAATTGLYLDESPIVGGFQNNFRGDGTPGLRMIDVNHVEVLKGPQGTLFGSGSMAGTVRVITNQPDLTDYSGSLLLSGAHVNDGNGYYTGNVVFNAPLVNDKLGIRLVGWGEWGGGYIDQTINGATIDNINNVNLSGARATALWQPVEQLHIAGSFTYQNTNVNGAQYWNAPSDAQPRAPVSGPYNNNETSLAPYHDAYQLINVTANYSLGFGEVIGIFTHGKNQTTQSFDSTPTNCGFGLCPPGVPPLSFVPILDYSDTTGELRFVSKFSGSVQLVAGAYYQTSTSNFQGSAVYDAASGYPGCLDVADCTAKGLRQPGNNFGGIPSNYLEFGTIDDLDIDQYAGYAQIDWKIIDPLTLTAGARYFSANIKDVTQSTQDIAPPNACNWVFGCVTTPYVTFDGKTKQSKTTYNFALLYAVSSNVNLYVRAASGFRIGGINTDYNPANLPQIPLGFEPDSLWDYEGGIKGYFFDRKLYVDLDYYHIDWSNQQINAIAEGAFEYTLNAGKTKTDGVDLDVTYLVTRGLTLRAGITYNNARLSTTLPQAVTDAGNGGNAGDPIPESPKLLASLAGTYQFPISNGVTGYATADVQYRDHTQLGFNPTDDFYTPIPSYVLGDLRGGVRFQRFELGLFVDNVTNKAAWAGVSRTTDGIRVFSPMPRTIGLSLRASF